MKIVFLDAGTMGATPMDEIAALGEFTVYNDTSREESFVRAADCEVAIVNKVIVDKEETEYLNRPEPDELYKILPEAENKPADV